MRNLKRALSLALALVMVLSMMVVGAGAVSVDDFSDASEIVNKEAVSVLATLNVINGKDDGSYDPTGTITRGEMAKMICVILNGGNDPVLGETVSNSYTDTANHWAKAYIEYCTTLGIVAGKGDGTFDPNGQVTVAEAAKMVLVALGYNAGVEGYTGSNWQINTDVRANALGLYGDLSYTNTSADLTRDNAAQMLYNALDCKVVTYSYIITGDVNNAITTKPQLNDRDQGTLLWEKFQAVKVEGVVVANEYANLSANREDTEKAPEGINIGSHLDAGKTTVLVTNWDEGTEQTIFKNQEYTFNVSTSEKELAHGVYLYVKPNTTTSDNASRATVIGSVNISEDNNVITDASGDTAKDVADDNNLDLTADTRYVYNYGGMSASAPSKNGWTGIQKTLIDTDNDGNVDYVLYKEMRLGKVTLKSDSGDGQLVVNVTGSKTTTKGNYIAKDKDDVMGFDNVAKDDFVLTAYIGGRLHVQVAETLTGTIEAYKQTEVKNSAGDVTGYRNTNITVDGENYTVSRVDTYTGTELTPAVDEFDKTILSSDATFYLDENGYLIAFGEVAEAAYKYAYVWAAEDAVNRIDSDRVKVTLEDGSTKTYELSSSSEIELVSGNTTSSPETKTAKAKIHENQMIGMIFSYAINSNGEIKLYLPKQGAVSGLEPNFTKGLTSITMANDNQINLLQPVEADSPVKNTYYSNNSTTFFYVETSDGNAPGTGNEIKKVNVYNGRNAAPSVDGSEAANAGSTAVLALNSKDDVGAAAFVNVSVTENAEDHLFVTAANYVSEDWCTVDAYLNGSTDLSTDLKAALYEDGEVVNNPVIKDGLYLYSIDADGNYELTKPTMVNDSYYFSGMVTRVNTGDSTFIVSDGTNEYECRILGDSIVVDNALDTVVAVAGGSVNLGDEIEVIVNNKDDREVLMIGILKHGDPTNTPTGPSVNWDGKTQPEGTVEVRITGNATRDTQAITDAFQAGKSVYIRGDLLNGDVDPFIIPEDLVLYVTSDVGTLAASMDDIDVRGKLMVGGDLYMDGTVNNLGVKGNWYVTSNNGIVTGTATIEKDVFIDALQILEVNGKLYADEVNARTGSATLEVAGHVEANNVNAGASGTVIVTSDTSLVVSGTIKTGALNIGDAVNDKAGRVTAKEVVASNVNVTVPGSSLVVETAIGTTAIPATVTVENATLRAASLVGTLTIKSDAGETVTVVVPLLDGTMDNSGVKGSYTITVGTDTKSEVEIKEEIATDATFNGKVTFAQNSVLGENVTVTINGTVEGLENLSGAEGAKVTFGRDVVITGGDSVLTKFTYANGDAVEAGNVARMTFTWDEKQQKFVCTNDPVYNGVYSNSSTPSAEKDTSESLYR